MHHHPDTAEITEDEPPNRWRYTDRLGCTWVLVPRSGGAVDAFWIGCDDEDQEEATQ